jgi:hypothetical protein
LELGGPSALRETQLVFGQTLDTSNRSEYKLFSTAQRECQPDITKSRLKVVDLANKYVDSIIASDLRA